MLRRCAWVNSNVEYQNYHDTEWGRPVHDDHIFFEFLTLEGAQAGLSWETILKRRNAYKKAFKQFDPRAVARMSDDELNVLLVENSGIIRNRRKIFSARKNAQVFTAIQGEFGSFSQYVWKFVNDSPIINAWTSIKQIPSHTLQSDALSKDLKKRGMSFVGTTIIYALMQATGLVNDHTTDCNFKTST
jgi:DNA-3-methyladenine glycosylase I